MLCKSIIIITGPTATGKTYLGIQVAKELGGEIISVDSRQIYRYMDIGTAKPDKAEQDQIPHHFINIANPDQCYSAGQFGRDVRKCIEQLGKRGVVPILVGGSGLYLQAVLNGFFEDSTDYAEIREILIRRLEDEGLEALYEELGELDPLAHARLSPRDGQRIMRALEVAHGSGESLVEHRNRAPEEPLNCIPLGVCLTMNREALYKRIDQRVEAMMQKGLLEEVEKLVKMGYGRGHYGMETFGYKELLDYLDGHYSLEEATNTVKRKSRQYAKRQLTWFRKDRRLRWLDVDAWGSQGIGERIIAQYRARIT
jgi:tRNA dimethylallyltransferase